MKSLKELYRIGTGPSSRHTMAPRKAAEQFLQRHPEAAQYRVTLFGSLAATGRGHLTDKVLGEVFQPRACEMDCIRSVAGTEVRTATDTAVGSEGK